MSIYGYFACLDCKVYFFLGKAVFRKPKFEEVREFSKASGDDQPNWKQEISNRVLWKMLADHARHSLKVVIEGDDDCGALDEFAEIGEPIEGNIDISTYIESD